MSDPTDPAAVLDAHVQQAVAILTLGISDALGPARPVSGVRTGDRRKSRVLLRAMERAYVELAGPSAQRAYDLMAENERKHPTPVPEPDDDEDDEDDGLLLSDATLLVDDRAPSVSVRAILSGLPTLGKGRR